MFFDEKDFVVVLFAADIYAITVFYGLPIYFKILLKGKEPEADIFNLVRQTNTSAQEAKVSAEALKAARDKIVELTGVLGVLLDLEDEIPEEITELANKRAEAKKAKDYAEADRIRDEIQSKGYTVKDVPGGFKIEKAN